MAIMSQQRSRTPTISNVNKRCRDGDDPSLLSQPLAKVMRPQPRRPSEEDTEATRCYIELLKKVLDQARDATPSVVSDDEEQNTQQDGQHMIISPACTSLKNTTAQDAEDVTKLEPNVPTKFFGFGLDNCPLVFTDDVLEMPDDVTKMQELYESIGKPFDITQLDGLPQNDDDWEKLMLFSSDESRSAAATSSSRQTNKIVAHAA